MARAKTDTSANRIAMLATHDNPVSIMELNKVYQFACRCVQDGLSEADAVAATRKLIQQLNGQPVE